MDSRHCIKLPSDLIARSDRYGIEVVNSYREGMHRASLAVSSHGAQFNTTLQGLARAAECAFCLWGGLDPNHLNWDHLRCDPGFDVSLNGVRFDVKNTGFNSRYLIWPINKRHIFSTKRFDALVLVKQRSPEFFIAGWMDKESFERWHETAGEGHALNAGTWYVDEQYLFGPDLIERARAA